MERNEDVISLLRKRSLVFWDFDGVIKDSVEAKTIAYEELFRCFGADVAERVREHHEANGGISRYEKIPLYLGWAGEVVIDEKVTEFCTHFSQLVFQSVIDSPWVPGVREYLLNHYTSQYFVLVTGTPQQEIEQILKELKIAHCFREYYGAPAVKSVLVHDALHRLGIEPSNAIMVGDAETDFNCAKQNHVDFVLRRTPLNRELQALHNGPAFDTLELL